MAESESWVTAENSDQSETTAVLGWTEYKQIALATQPERVFKELERDAKNRRAAIKTMHELLLG